MNHTYKKYFLPFLLILSFQISFQVEISDSLNLIKELFNPYGIIYQFFKLKLAQMDDSFSCTLCKRLVTAVRTTVEEKYSPDEIIHIVALFCSFSYSYDYCYNFYTNYGMPMVKNVFARITNSENFCHTLGFCPEGQLCEDAYDFAIRLLKDKPNKEKEKIDPDAPTLKMIQVTDLHYDSNYRINASIYCDTPLCCHEPASNYSRTKSGKYGSIINCATSIDTINAFVDAAYELNPDFIIWTGDNTEANNWNSTQEEVYEATQAIKNAIDAKFQNKIPIYPVIGNHEVYPCDIWVPGDYEIFKRLGEIYKDYFFEEQAYDTFSKFGYYTELHPNSTLRIVALNCFYCDSTNSHLLNNNHSDAKKQYIWLEEVLREAEANNESVYILEHFPINADFMSNECAKRLRAIFDRFDYTIRGYFSGHHHTDDIACVKRYFEPRPIININYIAPSLTTDEGINPSFRQYIIDSNTKNIIDYEQYRMNLTFSNLNNYPKWDLAYRATELFNVTDMTQFDKIFSIDVEGEYIKHRYTGNIDDKKTHDKDEIIKAKCMMTSDSFYDYYICTEHSMISEDFFHEFMNDLGGEWPLE